MGRKQSMTNEITDRALNIFSVLAEIVLWDLSIVSSLSLYSILVQHACNDHAWLTSECSLTYGNFGTA